jgi:hypothetical protein
MRFARRKRHPEFTDTSRKRAAVKRLHQRQQDKLPLFAPLIAETQKDVDTVMAERAEAWIVQEQRDRDRQAAKWREARRKLATTGNMRPYILKYWNEHRWLPAEPWYLLDLVHSIRKGHLVIEDDGTIRSAASKTWLPVPEVRRRFCASAVDTHRRKHAEQVAAARKAREAGDAAGFAAAMGKAARARELVAFWKAHPWTRGEDEPAGQAARIAA